MGILIDFKERNYINFTYFAKEYVEYDFYDYEDKEVYWKMNYILLFLMMKNVFDINELIEKSREYKFSIPESVMVDLLE